MTSSDLSDTKNDKDSRRERGKIAQREYRKRHASTFQTLKEENQLLKDAVKHLCSTAAGLHPQHLGPNLSAAIAQVREAAGIQPPFANDIGTLASASNHQEGLSAPDSSSEMAVLDEEALFNVGPSMTDVGIALPPPTNEEQYLGPGRPGSSSPLVPAKNYFGQHMFSLGGRLFWDCMTYNFIRLQRLHSGTTARTDPCPTNAVYVMSEEDQNLLWSLALTRLRYKDPQPNAGMYECLESPSSLPIQMNTALHEYMGRCSTSPTSGYSNDVISSAQWWKSPAGVEEIARDKLTEAEMELVEGYFANPNPGEDGERVIRLLTQALVPNAIYFPDGPKWSLVYLSMVLGTWVRNIRGLDMNVPEN